MRAGAGSDNRAGFTLIEIVIAIVLLSLIILPVAAIVMENLRVAEFNKRTTVTTNLARAALAKVNAMPFANITNVTTPTPLGYGFDWLCTMTTPFGGTYPVKMVRARIFKHGSTTQLTELVTYCANFVRGAGSSGGATGEEAKSFSATGGDLKTVNLLNNVIMANTRTTGNITMTSIRIVSSMAISLTSINVGLNEVKFAGSVPISTDPIAPTTVVLQKTLIMNTASYTVTFGFSGGAAAGWNPAKKKYPVIQIQFFFYDNTSTPAPGAAGVYRWS